MSALFNNESTAIFWNNNAKAIQRMLDYGYICRRESPSVAAIVHPSSQASVQKFFFGPKEIMIPIFRSTREAVEAFPNSDVFLNFASFRTAYDVSMEALEFPNIKTMMVTAEGIPERLARNLVATAKEKGCILIGPATVGAITPGAFKTANIGGTIENIAKIKLHRPGSAGLVTRSGGLFNELANIIAINADGISEGVAIGGDRYPGSSFLDHMLRMEKNPKVKYIVLLGEVGGTDEYEVIDAIQSGQITKPVIAWCIGTIASAFANDVQFGHAGAKANSQKENASEKNTAFAAVGAHVPQDFNELPSLINKVYQQETGQSTDPNTQGIPDIPEDYNTAKKEGRIRKGTSFICTISDDRGDEANYAGYPISAVATPDTGFSISDVVSLLWFKKRYPEWASHFIETVIKTVADHGPAVSGAHNARVTARAGKDLIDSVASGILTIGPRFGGAIDGAAQAFKHGQSQNLGPRDFVSYMKKQGTPIPGIGHRIKSIKNPDLRVTALINYAKGHFPEHSLLDYALSVEAVTSSKKGNLILNVDGCIGVLMVDMWRGLGYDEEQIDFQIESGALNGFFLLGRTIGLIGHVLDEKRLNMPLYRHEFDDILYEVQKADSL